MKSLLILTLTVLAVSAEANPCYFNSGSLSGKVAGVKMANNAQLAIRHYSDGNHINRMVLKSGKMTVEATYSCTDTQPIECTLGDYPFQLVFDGSGVKIVTRKAQLAVGTYISDEVELAVIPAREDNEITLTSAPAKACYKLLPYSDKIETFPEPER